MSRIEITNTRAELQDALTIEQYLKRRVARRRRVAKRKLKAVPLFAVEEMQGEFPGYTMDEFISDVTRKTRKGKSFRRPKKRGFDWKLLNKELPEFVRKCVKRTKTTALIRFRLKSGLEFSCIIRSYWHGEYGESRMDTRTLIKLFQGTIQELVKHPAVIVLEHKTDLFNINE